MNVAASIQPIGTAEFNIFHFNYSPSTWEILFDCVHYVFSFHRLCLLVLLWHVPVQLLTSPGQHLTKAEAPQKDVKVWRTEHCLSKTKMQTWDTFFSVLLQTLHNFWVSSLKPTNHQQRSTPTEDHTAVLKADSMTLQLWDVIKARNRSCGWPSLNWFKIRDGRNQF